MPHYRVASFAFPRILWQRVTTNLLVDTLPLLSEPRHLVEFQQEQTNHSPVEKSKIRKPRQVVDIVSKQLYSTIVVTTKFQMIELDVEAIVLAMALPSVRKS